VKFRNSIVFSSLLFGSIAFAADVLLEKADFVSAKEIKRGSNIVIQGRLSDSGLKKIKSDRVQAVQLRIAGVDRVLKLRGSIAGDSIEGGPFTHKIAEKIVEEINR
jgi:hypothetical protein